LREKPRIFYILSPTCSCLKPKRVIYKLQKVGVSMSLWIQCILHYFFWVIPMRLNFICRRFGTLYQFHLHRRCTAYIAYKGGTECSETSAYKIQTPRNYERETIKHSEQANVWSQVHCICLILQDFIKLLIKQFSLVSRYFLAVSSKYPPQHPVLPFIR